MNSIVPYRDRRVEITDACVIFHQYYFPFGSRRIDFSQIEFITKAKYRQINGKWTIVGTGLFCTWFPHYPSCLEKKSIFVLKEKGQFMRIGFAVEDPEKVLSIFRKKNILKEIEQNAEEL